MVEITAKELSALSDLLTVEQNVIAKYRDCACRSTEEVLKNRYEQLAQRHQRHFNELYSNLK